MPTTDPWYPYHQCRPGNYVFAEHDITEATQERYNIAEADDEEVEPVDYEDEVQERSGTDAPRLARWRTGERPVSYTPRPLPTQRRVAISRFRVS